MVTRRNQDGEMLGGERLVGTQLAEEILVARHIGDRICTYEYVLICLVIDWEGCIQNGSWRAIA